MLEFKLSVLITAKIVPTHTGLTDWQNQVLAKILSFGKNKKYLFFLSLIRTFAPH